MQYLMIPKKKSSKSTFWLACSLEIREFSYEISMALTIFNEVTENIVHLTYYFPSVP